MICSRHIWVKGSLHIMKRKTQKKAVGIVLLLLLLIVGAVYIAISVFYRSHFYNGTTINDIDVSNYSIEDVKNVITSGTDTYALTLEGRGDVMETIEGSSVDLKPVWNGEVENLLEQQSGFAWLIKEFRPDAYKLETMIGFDQEKLKSVLESLPFMKPENQVAPQDAAISDYIPQKGYELVPSKEGTALDETVLLEAMNNAIDSLEPALNLEETGCYYEPSVMDDDETLNSRLDTLNEYCQAKITYTVGDDVFDLDADTYHDWFIIGDDGSITIDGELARDYVKSLGHKYNTCYSTRNFETSYGQTVKIDNSDYGWKVDYDTETAQVIEEINSHTVTTRDLNYLMVANSHNSPDYGDSYVEINLTSQHLFLYKDGKLVIDTDFVSGRVIRGNATPCGIFGLTYKTKDATLRGSTYESHVDYWMPFNGNIGMHDATWRSTFGAAIYIRNGSHGCINLPHSAAETIYDAIEKDYPVIVYELPGTESEKGKAQIAAYDVIDLIDAIGTVTKESGDKIEAARTAYDALTDLGKGYVKNKDTLTAAETAYKKLVKDDDKKADKSDSKKDNKKEETKEDKSKDKSAAGDKTTDDKATETYAEDGEGADES